MEKDKSLLELLGSPQLDLGVLEPAGYQPIGDNAAEDVVGGFRGIEEEVLELVEGVEENPDTPVDNARRRAEARYKAKALRLYAQRRRWYKPYQRKRGPKRKLSKKQRLEIKREFKRKYRRNEYGLLAVSGVYWDKAVFNANLNRVPWEITREEWDEAGIEEIVAEEKSPRMKRKSWAKPWTLDNLVIFGDSGTVLFDRDSVQPSEAG